MGNGSGSSSGDKLQVTKTVKPIADIKLHRMAGALSDAVKKIGHETKLSQHMGHLLKSYMSLVRARNATYKVSEVVFRDKNNQLEKKVRALQFKIATLKDVWKREKKELLEKIASLR